MSETKVIITVMTDKISAEDIYDCMTTNSSISPDILVRVKYLFEEETKQIEKILKKIGNKR